MGKLVRKYIRVDDFIAEQIEQEANRLPPSAHAERGFLLDYAARLRQTSSTKVVRIWETEPKSD